MIYYLPLIIVWLSINANFTMMRPDDSLFHNHVVDNFISTNVIFEGNSIVVTGVTVTDVYSDRGT